MLHQMRGLGWAIAQSSAVVIGLAIGLIDGAMAQIVPDQTLGAEGSRVTPNVQVRGRAADRIDGGAVRGANLFHSFQEFNVGNGQRVYFANPTDVRNILTRVTGNNLSNILGTLGVDGGANLFLMNPNGIVFGQNARLDVAGSFVGTTANRFTFWGGSEFSATDPQAASLLTVNVPIGLQWGANPRATIANTGHLTTGQDLTLSGNTLDLQGRLQAGRNLTLQAQDRLRVRDSVTNPFVAAAGGQMLVQGDRAVDIFALNHPSSGFFSGGDMVLRSGDRVGGDAHYWSGENFAIEQLDGSLGDLYSPNDPVIRVAGDLYLSNYTGASLHILAGGFVYIPGTIRITDADGVSTSLAENVTLSNRTVLPINGNARPTLDIRAGVNPAAIGNPLGLVGEADFDDGLAFNNPSSSDILVGLILAPSGQVLLTNQYKPNNALVPGNIVITGRGTLSQGIDTRSTIGNGGSVTIDSRNNIATVSGIRTASSAGNSGDITLLAAGDINLTQSANINANILGAGNAGNILLDADGRVLLSGTNAGILSNVTSDNFASGGVGRGGTVIIRAGSLALSNQTIIDVSTFGNGDAGKIAIDVDGAVTLESGSFIFNNIEENAVGNTGGIEIRAGSLALSGNSQILVANTNGIGTLGDIFIDTKDFISLTGVFNPLVSSVGTGIGNRLGAGSVGTGGNIIINTGSLSLSGSQISASTFGEGNAGNVLIDTRGSVVLAAAAGIFSAVDSGAVGNGGKIQIDANSLAINQSAIQTIVRGAFNGLPAGRGNAGNVTVNLQGDLDIVDNDNIRVGVGILTAIAEGVTETAIPGDVPTAGDIRVRARDLSISGSSAQLRSALDLYSVGESGDIDVQVRSLTMSNNAEITTGTSGKGNAGNISIEVTDSASLTTNSTISSGVSDGGNGNSGTIDFEAGSLSVTNGSQFLTSVGRIVANTNGEVQEDLSSAQGNAGDVRIAVRGVASFDGVGDGVRSGIRSAVSSELGGTGGDIAIQSGALVISNRARFSSQTDGIGRAGNISINAGQVKLSNNAVVTSSTSSSGNAGNISVNARQVTLSNDSVVGSSTSSSGNAGNISVDTNRLLLRSGSSLFTDAFSNTRGNAGNITVNASESVEVVGTSAVDQDINGVPDASGLYAQARGAGKAGDLRVNTRRLSIRDGGTISAETSGSGHGGSIFIDASDLVEVTGGSPEQSFSSSINADVETDASGDAGNVNIKTGRLIAREGGFISSSAGNNSTGDAGNVIINADSIELTGQTLDRDNPTAISVAAEPGATGNVGNITIAAQRLSLRDGASVLAQNLGSGQSGTIQLDATDSIEVVGGNGEVSLINAAAYSNATGRPGDIRLHTQNLRLLNGGQISAATLGRVNGGNIQIRASDIEIVGTSADGILPSGITAISVPLIQGNGGRGGNIDVRARNLRLRGGASISANTFGQADAGDIVLNASDSILLDRGTISTIVESSAIGQGGEIKIQTGALDLGNRSSISSSTSGQGNTGQVSVRATGSIGLSGGSRITSEVNQGATGNSQNITLRSPSLILRGESAISAATDGNGSAGDISIRSNILSLSNSNISTEVQANAIVPSSAANRASNNDDRQGNIEIETRSLRLDNGAKITASTNGQGRAGNVSITANALEVTRGGQISTSTTTNSRAGNITLRELEQITLDGNNSGFSARTAANSSGRGGNIQITTDRLNIQNRAGIAASSRGTGRAGNVEITAHTAALDHQGQITAGAISAQGGDVVLRIADMLRLTHNSRISASTQNGQGGQLSLNGDRPPTHSVELSGSSQITTAASRAAGTAGGLNLNTETLNVNNSNVTVSNPRGRAGNLAIAANRILLDNGNLTAQTGKTQGQAGANIRLQDLDLLLMRNGSQIDANAGDQANGGNITIGSQFIVAVPSEDSNIRANAVLGQGGNVQITTEGLFGIQPAMAPIPGVSDITASSEQGVQGAVTINQPNTDPSRGLIELPTIPIDATNQIAAACPTNAQEADRFGSFIVSGRGGLPPNPIDLLSEDNILTEWVTPGEHGNIKAEIPSPATTQPIIEAQSWVINPQGKVILVAPSAPVSTPTQCK